MFGIFAGGMLYVLNFYSFMFFRFCQGVVVGVFSVIIPLIIKETAPTEISGSLGTLTQLSICTGGTTGCLLSYILKQVTKDDTGKDFWFITFSFNTFVLVIQTLMLLFVFPY